MKKLLKFTCIFLLIFAIVTMPFTQVEAKKMHAKKYSYKTNKSLSKKSTKKRKKDNNKGKNNQKAKNNKKAKKNYKVVKNKKIAAKNAGIKKIKYGAQKQTPNKILAITLPSQRSNSYATTNGQKREPRRCPNVRCRYIGVKPCPWHGKNYPNHWK